MKRGQAATEYLIISGFVFMMLLPMVYLIYNYSAESTADIADAQLTKIGLDLVNTAESVYYFSEPSKITLEINMPDGVRNMSIVTNHPSTGCQRCTELRFELQKANFKQVLPFNSRIEIRSDRHIVSTDPGIPHLSKFDKRYYSPGLKRFRIQANPDYSLITLI